MNEENKKQKTTRTPRRTRAYHAGARPIHEKRSSTPRTRKNTLHNTEVRIQRGGRKPMPQRNDRNNKDEKPRRRVRSQARPRQSMTSPALEQREVPEHKRSTVAPVTSDDVIRIVAVSGAEEVGRNMYFFEDKNDIVIFDCGMQFVSPEQKAPGVNYILPNTQYLEENKHKIRALVISHGHLDHIGGIQFVIERLGNPPIYTQYLTSLLIQKRQAEFPHLTPLDMHVVKEGDGFTLGKHGLKVRTFPVTHSIPDAMGIIVETKHGNIVFTGDVRLDHHDEEIVGPEKKWWESVGKDNNLIMIADSTNCDQPGFSRSEHIVFENLARFIKDTPGRLIIGTFASQFERLMSIIHECEKLGKVIVPEGRSIKTNIEIALAGGFLKVKPGTIVSVQEAEKYPRDRIVVLATGAQGEEFAALSRMATGTHKFIKFDDRDTVVLSSSVIPGNELSVQALKDRIFRNNTRVVTYRGANVHASGHGYAGEMAWIRRTVNPRYLMPIHGNHFHLKSHMLSAVDDGFSRDNVFVPDNGSILEIHAGKDAHFIQEKIPNDQLTVDGLSVGLRQEVVLRDRLALSNDGMFVIVATLDMHKRKMRKSPDIISRGFVYLRENQQLLNDSRNLIKKIIEQSLAQSRNIDISLLKDDVTSEVTKFLLKRTNKTPIVIPVIIGF